MKRMLLAVAVVTSSLVLGSSGLALAQQGIGNVPRDGEVINQMNAEGALSGATSADTTGYSERQEHSVPQAWQEGQKPSEPLLPRH